MNDKKNTKVGQLSSHTSSHTEIRPEKTKEEEEEKIICYKLALKKNSGKTRTSGNEISL